MTRVMSSPQHINNLISIYAMGRQIGEFGYTSSNYCGEITYAMKALEALTTGCNPDNLETGAMMCIMAGKWHVSLGETKGHNEWKASNKSLPMAICLAILKALDVVYG